MNSKVYPPSSGITLIFSGSALQNTDN